MFKKLAAVALQVSLAFALAGCGGGESQAPPSSTPGPSATAAATPAAEVSPEPTVESPPPDLEGRLLFSRFQEATHSFLATFTAAPDGSDERELPLPGPEGGGSWSRSGSEIATMTILADGRIGTAIIAPDGAVLRTLNIDDPTLNLVCTTWSPDDTLLACEGWDDTDDSRQGIYVVSAADGSGIRRLTEPPSGSADLPGDISASGQLVFKRYSGDEAPGPLWLIPLTGGEAAQLSETRYEDPGSFDPSGERIATSRGGQIVILDGAGEILKLFDPGQRFEFGPSWSPDGEWIVFSSTAGGFRADLFIASPDGSRRFQITRTPDNEIAVDWGPDAPAR